MVTEGGAEIRNLKLKQADALIEEPKVPADGRNVVASREIGMAAGMRYKSFERGYGLDQGRRREEPGADGARTWRRT